MNRLVWICTLALSVLGCDVKPFEAVRSGARSLASTGSSDLVPPTDKLDPQCLTSDEYDSCIFQKNPVAQANAPLSGTAQRPTLESSQIFGVKLSGVTGSGYLENSSIKIITRKTERLPLSDIGRLKSRVSDESKSDVEQLMAYYYFNRAIEYWSWRGGLAVQNSGLSVVVDDSVAGFRYATKTIHLSRKTGKLSMAFDASVSLYYLGQANAELAANGNLNSVSPTTHRLCQSDPVGCCQTRNGCARALLAGSSTYFVGVMFPDRPVVGEMAENRLAGARICSAVDRNLNTASTLTADTAFNACATARGDVQAMGLVYASFWWDLRRSPQSSAEEIDRLYLEHLKILRGDDTFVSAKAKILQLNQTLFSGRYSNILDAAFTAKGI